MKAYVKPVFPTGEENDRFRREEADWRLRWRCADCAHYAPSTRLCSLEYPNDSIREATLHTDEKGNYRFCKYFEAA